MLTPFEAVLVGTALTLSPGAPAQTLDTLPPLGVAGRLSDGSTCMSAPPGLAPGTTLRAVQVPLDGSAPESPDVVLRVDRAGGVSCAARWGLSGDSAYAVTQLGSDARPGGAEPMLVLLDAARWTFRAGPSGWHLIHEKDGLDLTARACTSSEGIHVTLWAGPTLTGQVVWHRYYYLGYDVEPSCTDADYGGGVP
jgi:hypothetical protein